MSIWSSIAWALFGNDDDGVYGERSMVPTFGPDASRTAWQRWRWWCRNPAHNLVWHAMLRPDGFLWTWGDTSPGKYSGYLGFRKPEGAFGCRLWARN